MVEVTYTRHLTQLEKNKEWFDGRLEFKGDFARLYDENGYLVVGNIHHKSVHQEKKGRYIVASFLVDVDEEDLPRICKWKKIQLDPPVAVEIEKGPGSVTPLTMAKAKASSLLQPFKAPLVNHQNRLKRPRDDKPGELKPRKQLQHRDGMTVTRARQVFNQTDITNLRGLVQPYKRSTTVVHPPQLEGSSFIKKKQKQ